MPQTVGQYLGATKGPVVTQHDVSDDYRRNYPLEGALSFGRYLEEGRPDESFGEWKERVRRAD
jgi:hypothetical protein